MKPGKLANLIFVLLVVVFVLFIVFRNLWSSKPITKEKTTTAIVVNNSLRDSIVNFGTALLGTPYVAAGCTEDGFDCSGFVYYVYHNFDIDVPRSSADFEHYGKEVPLEDVEKGDLLLFLSPTRNAIGHIGIVTTAKGKESEFIHATSGREMKVVISSMTTKGYADRFVKAVRVL